MTESEFNEHKIPPGGWQFYQPETKWRAPTPISSTLNQTGMLIIKMRKANAATTAKFKLATNPEAVKAEILKFNRKRLGLSEESVAAPFSGSRKSSASAAGGVAGAEGTIAGLKRAAQGTAVGLEWLGKGAKPVAQELADKRAATCVVCPKHTEGEWYVTAPAELVKKSIEAWKAMTGAAFEFKTSQGDNLKSCGVCKCLMTLKTFVPLEHILARTPPEIMQEFPSTCWIKNNDA